MSQINIVIRYKKSCCWITPWSEVDMNIPLDVVSKNLPISENALNIKYNEKENSYQSRVFNHKNYENGTEILNGAYKMSSEGKFLSEEGGVSDTRPKK
ncbi:hypothetical protein [Bacteroidetes bacterium endosymbiont of Geopemphigus sp.]|uniref:hypothetical protein n=1 Tax=Bacteroidetes bacterium endosymbiont of Geopemphigus sp. TaxID=2047937 RepID=UPI000CD1518A|nr:hypothetical protein [Bacteroidetes bacterium endosymbiont of Geopemphigus sp.]